MASNWKQVPIDQARHHPLYGVGGWLIVFAVGLVLGIMLELGAVRGAAYEAGIPLSDLLSIDNPAISFLKLAFGLHFLIVVIIYWLMLSKNPSFRKITSMLLVASWPASALLGVVNPFPGFGAALGLSFFSWVLSCGVWVTYLHRSKRVRVTFEHRVAAPGPVNLEVVSPYSTSRSLAARTPATNLDAADSNSRRNRMLREAAVTPATNFEGVAPLNGSDAQRHAATTSDEELWAIAAHEMDSQARRVGLWAKAFAEARGSEPEAKVNYLNWRVSQLQQEFEDCRKQTQEAQRVAEEREQEVAIAEIAKQKAECPSCARVISFAETICPHCRASFELGSAYKLVTLCGQCPNCDAVIPLMADKCPKCRANFGSGSAWKPVPVKT